MAEWSEPSERTINLADPADVTLIGDFLAKFDLTFEADVEFTTALFQDDRIVATGSFAGEVLRNIAVDESVQGAGLTATIVSRLMQEQGNGGRLHYFLFTNRPKHIYLRLWFKEIARASRMWRYRNGTGVGGGILPPDSAGNRPVEARAGGDRGQLQPVHQGASCADRACGN